MIELEKKLIASKLLRDNEEIELFEKTIQTIIADKEINDLSILFKGFDDNSEEFEVTFGLIHTVELYSNFFGDKEYINYLIESAKYMLRNNAITWFDILIKRILNEEDARIEFKNVILSKDKKSKEIIYNSLQRIINDNSEVFLEKSQDILNLLENAN